MPEERGPDLAARAAAQQAYLESRFTPDPNRDKAWRILSRYLQRYWQPGASVLDVGAGYCTFVNNVEAPRRVAVDIHPRLAEFAAAGVETIEASATDLSPIASETFDVVFASNLLEHLGREEVGVALGEFQRVLRPRGRVILMQPNFRFCAPNYFDDYTHLTPLSDRSLADLLVVAGFELVDVQPRFLPLTLKSGGGRLSSLMPLYLRLPWRPLAGQMLIVAERPSPR